MSGGLLGGSNAAAAKAVMRLASVCACMCRGVGGWVSARAQLCGCSASTRLRLAQWQHARRASPCQQCFHPRRRPSQARCLALSRRQTPASCVLLYASNGTRRQAEVASSSHPSCKLALAFARICAGGGAPWQQHLPRCLSGTRVRGFELGSLGRLRGRPSWMWMFTSAQCRKRSATCNEHAGEDVKRGQHASQKN